MSNIAKNIFMKIFLFLFSLSFLNAQECSPYFNPKKFYETPQALSELLDETFPNGIFSNTILLDETFKDSLILENEVLKKDSFVQEGDYIYPNKNGLWKYKKIKTKLGNRIDEVNISKSEIYRFADIDIANTINDDYDNFWNDYVENAYEMQLTPEQTLFRYNNAYFTMSVFIYGVKGDSTPLQGTVINLWLKDYTKEVNTYIECIKGKK